MSAALQITMPRLSDSMEEGTLVRWIKHDGDTVSVGDELAEIESDKATVVYEAEGAGILSTMIDEGATVAVGTVIGWLARAQALAGEKSRVAGQAKVPAGLPAFSDDARVEPRARPQAFRRKVSPVARRIAAAHGIDLDLIEGTGPDGRVMRADLKVRRTPPAYTPAWSAPADAVATSNDAIGCSR